MKNEFTYYICTKCNCIYTYSKYGGELISWDGNNSLTCLCPSKDEIRLTLEEYKMCKLLYHKG